LDKISGSLFFFSFLFFFRGTSSSSSSSSSNALFERRSIDVDAARRAEEEAEDDVVIDDTGTPSSSGNVYPLALYSAKEMADIPVLISERFASPDPAAEICDGAGMARFNFSSTSQTRK